jgi:transposase
MVAEARKHAVFRLLETVPGLGPIRVSHLMATVVSPQRFRTRRQFWQYIGFGVVMRSSSDWIPEDGGRWRRDTVQHTRGLTRNYNRELKGLFKGAATTVVTHA